MIFRLIGSMFPTLLFAIAAWAADPFTVTDVPVDARAANALEARVQAITDGQVRAANTLIKRMSLAEDRAARGFTSVSQEDGEKMIRALEIANEKRSANRYLADITIAFNRAAVEQYMHAKGLTLVSTQSRTRLVIPVLEGQNLWAPNSWSEAWNTANLTHALTPMQAITPHPELGNIVGGQSFTMDELKTIGALYGAQQILITTAREGLTGYTVTVQDFSLDTKLSRNLGTVSGQTAPLALAAVVTQVEDEWKRSTVTTVSNTIEILSVSVLYNSHSEWQQLQDVINGSAQIHSARLDAFSKTGALMSFTYGGNFERLRNELAFKGVSLRTDDKLGMILTRAGAF